MEQNISPVPPSNSSTQLSETSLKRAVELLVNHRDASLADEADLKDAAHKLSETARTPSWSTLSLAAHDVRAVIEQQREQSGTMTTKLNILFVVNGALLTSLTISRLLFMPSLFSLCEIFGFLINFILLINAFLPRQAFISPNLKDKKFLERYLTLTPTEYQLRMMVNLVQTYQANEQRLDDVSQSLTYSAYVTLAIAFIIMSHTLAAYFLPVLQSSQFSI